MDHTQAMSLRFITGCAAMIAMLSTAGLVSAQSYENHTPNSLPYTDRSSIDAKTAVSIGILTDAGVFEGNEDGSFRMDSALNRAEFVTIALRLLNEENATVNTRCFPDVAENAWYANSVCRAKELGLVRGNVDVNLTASQWRFEPTRNVLYAEAVKILVELYALPVQGETEGNDWYVPYINAATQNGLSISGIRADEAIRRGEMARLTARFYTDNKGALDLLIEAEERDPNASSSSSSSVSSSSSSSSSSVHTGYDPLDRLSVRSRFTLSGEASPVLADAEFFLEEETFIMEKILITLTDPNAEVQSMLVYDNTGLRLGRATLDQSEGPGVYILNLSDDITVAQATTQKIYVRAVLRDKDDGAQSNVALQVESIVVEGRGEFSNSVYVRTIGEDFPEYTTSFGTVSDIRNAGDTEDVLLAGNNQVIGSFLFTGEAQDSQTDVRITGLTFTIERTTNVLVSNVSIRDMEGGMEIPCTTTLSTISCSVLPATMGSLKDGPRTFRVYGDVTITSNDDSRLRLVLNAPGSTSSAGAVMWTDGTSVFEWLPMEQPIVRGTLYTS